MKKRIILLKDMLVQGKAYVTGTIIDVSEAYATELIESKSAEFYVDNEITVVEPEKIDTKKIEKKIEVKTVDLTPKAENIEVKAPVLSPETKLANSFKVAKAIATGVYDAETKAIAGQGETVAADGGALIDNTIVDGIYSNANAAAQILPLVSQRPVGRNTNALEIKQLDESSGTPADYNGVTLDVVSEGGSISATKRAFTNASAAVNKLVAMIPFTSEILEDGAHGIVAATERDVGIAYGLKIDQEILYGTSSLLTASVGDGGSRAVTLADASAPTAAEVESMYMSNINPSAAQWFMSGAVYQSLMSLESTLGMRMLTPNYAMSPFGTLLGRPVNVVSAMLGANGEAGTIGFCSWADGYVIGTKGGVKMAKSIHLYFDTDQEAYRWILRIAGLPTKAATMTLADARVVAPLVFGDDS